MTGTDIKATARRVLEEIFPADDEAALAEMISENFVNHEAQPAHHPAWPASPTTCTCSPALFRPALGHPSGARRGRHRRDLLHPQGRHTGEFFGLPATGRSFAYKQMHMILFADGKGAEHLGSARRRRADAPAHHARPGTGGSGSRRCQLLSRD